MGGLYHSWYDARLQWDPSRYGDIREIVVPNKKVWVPYIYYLNPADNMVPVGNRYFTNRVNRNGVVVRNACSIMKTTCEVDITYFPFDQQTCEIDFYTFGYYSTEVYLKISNRQVDMFYFRKNSQWNVQSAIIKPHDNVEFNGTITAVLVLKRHPEYFTVNILIPVLFLCLLNPVVFLLPVESGERISYTVTIFLSLAVFMTLVNDNMPKSSKPMSRLSVLLIMMIGSSTVLCLLAIIITKIYFKDDSNPVPNWTAKILHIMKFRWCSKFFKMRRVESYDISSDAGTSQTVSDDNIRYIKKEKDFAKENFQDDSYQNNDNRNDDDDHSQEKMSWKQLALEMDQVAFIYSVIFLIITLVVFIVDGLLAK
ncbi:hypothetical protein FSP39_024558 [Pinctada imbricata]|uniref:Uncharacterized protein n=1 Tax=Pinctada imbricata TaxID=66713 RepID=A0AA89C8P9_PINIB|nr:hypothetical protein FSP39_024558 [Pinctada imbricata]